MANSVKTPLAQGRHSAQLIEGYFLIDMDGRTALIDTGAPMTIPALPGVSEAIGEEVDLILGTDTLRPRPFTLDYRKLFLAVHDTVPEIEGRRWVLLAEFQGVFLTDIALGDRRYPAIIDTGAPTTYAPAGVLEGRPVVRQCQDFYPRFGYFPVNLVALEIEHHGRTVNIEAAALPPALAGRLPGSLSGAWILGWDLLKDRKWLFDLANRRFADITEEE